MAYLNLEWESGIIISSESPDFQEDLKKHVEEHGVPTKIEVIKKPGEELEGEIKLGEEVLCLKIGEYFSLMIYEVY